MLSVKFTDGGFTLECTMPADELRAVLELKPTIDFEADGYKAIALNYEADTGLFVVWLEKDEGRR